MNKLTDFLPLLILLIITSFASIAIDQDELLDADVAFSSKILDITNDEIKLRFNIADKYYLYKHTFKFPNEGNALELSEAQIPDGKKKKDDFFGEVETYYHQVDIVIPYSNPQAVTTSQFKYKYQGCAEAGVCYPPQTKTIQLSLPQAQQEQTAAIVTSNPLGLGANNQWNGQQSVLPEDQAFKLETIAMEANKLSARFTMGDNIYLYKDKVKLTSLTDGISINNLIFPKAQIKNDPHFGEVEVFFNQIEVDVDISRNNNSKVLQLQAEFQGCVDEGICYPPSKRTINVDLPENTTVNKVSDSTTNKLSEQDQIQADLEKNSWWKTIIRFFGFGLLLALTPCIFPMIPILSGLIMGQGEITRSRSFMLSLVYVLAMALAYTVAGVIAGMLGANIQAAMQKPAVIIVFSLVFVALAMSMFGFYELQLPASWQSKLSKVSNKQKSGSYIGVGIMGFLSAIIVGPCVAPPLAGAVLYISNTGNPIVGGFALFAMSIGMGVPLLLIGASAGKWIPQSGGWMNVVKSFFGIALIGMAIWFLSRIIPSHIALALYGILALVSSIFWIRYAMKNVSGTKLKALFLVLKVLLIIVGAIEIVGAIKGNTDPLHPLTKSNHFEFTIISNVAELDQAIINSDKPVLLDFYADWCIECIHMERETYSDTTVQKTLEKFLVLKADVTDQNDADKVLMKKFKIIGPPATLFFGTDNKLINQYSFFGFKNAEEFVKHLNKL